MHHAGTDNELATSAAASMSGALVVVDATGQITWVNQATCDVLSRTHSDLLEIRVEQLAHSDDAPRLLDALRRTRDRGESVRSTVRFTQPNGGHRSMEVTTDPLSHGPVDGLVLALRDTLPGRRDAQSIERSSRMTNAVLDALSDGIVATDQFGRPLAVNDIARGMFGLSLDQPAGAFSLDDFALADADGRPVTFAAATPAATPVDRTAELRVVAPNAAAAYVTVYEQSVDSDHGDALGSVMIFRDVTAARQATDSLRLQALHDQLTGLPNRRQLDEWLDDLATREPSVEVAACFIDLDGFKDVNDTAGHATGDRLIRLAAERLQRVLRYDDLLIRLGGDEFVSLHVDIETPDGVVAVADRLRTALSRQFSIDDQRFDITASVGVAFASSAATDTAMLLRNADLALYAAKRRGRNRVEVFDGGLEDAVSTESERRALLCSALDDGRMHMHFQPIVSTTDQATFGYEALARLQLPDGAIIEPAGFLASSIPADLMFRFDQSAFEQSCVALRLLGEVGSSTAVFVSCNLSLASLAHPGVVEFMVDTATHHDVDPSRLCIEVTELTASATSGTARASLLQLHEAGFRLALDNFGTGPSSLAQLRDLPIDTVKVDRRVIADLAVDGPERAITHAIVDAATGLGMRVVAEGVESAELLACAAAVGFPCAQGWHFAQPAPLEAVLESR